MPSSTRWINVSQSPASDYRFTALSPLATGYFFFSWQCTWFTPRIRSFQLSLLEGLLTKITIRSWTGDPADCTSPYRPAWSTSPWLVPVFKMFVWIATPLTSSSCFGHICLSLRSVSGVLAQILRRARSSDSSD